MMQQVNSLQYRGFSTGTQKEAEKAPEQNQEEAKQTDAQDKKKQTKNNEDSSSSSSDEEATADKLSKEDIKQIKNLIKEQEAEIEKLKEQVKTLKEKYIY